MVVAGCLNNRELKSYFKNLGKVAQRSPCLVFRYYLNLVLIDEDDRRYYKTREIQLWRRWDKFYRTYRNADSSGSSVLTERTSDKHSHLSRNQSVKQVGGCVVSKPGTNGDPRSTKQSQVEAAPMQSEDETMCNSQIDAHSSHVVETGGNNEDKESADGKLLQNCAMKIEDERHFETGEVCETGKEIPELCYMQSTS